MIDPPDRPSFLAELDERQEEVLRQLEDLNTRIETIIREFSAGRTTERAVA